MKRIRIWRWVPAALLLAAGVPGARAESFAIQSFDGTGRLSYSTLNNGTNYNYRVEWAPAPAGPWSDFSSSGANWLGSRPRAGGDVVTNAVPMCYRVVATRGDFLVIDISGGMAAPFYPVTYYRTLADVPGVLNSDAYKTTNILLRLIPKGPFIMGSRAGEFGRYSNETQHEVTLSRDFYIGLFEVTQRQWELVMGNRPSYFTNAIDYATRPVEQVSYYDIRENPANSDDPAVDWPNTGEVNANSFMGRLRAKTGLPALDLPTEAQWECACRAGTSTAISTGYNLTNTGKDTRMDAAGRYWYNGGSDGNNLRNCSVAYGTASVGSYPQNAYGLYDVHGNAWEWCLDWVGAYADRVQDPAGPSSGDYRIVRGGGWTGTAVDCRSAHRYAAIVPSNRGNYFGFRIAMTVP